MQTRRRVLGAMQWRDAMARSKSHPGLEELGLGIPPYLQPRLLRRRGSKRIVQPVHVALAAAGHGRDQGLRHVIGVHLQDGCLQLLVQVPPALDQTQPFYYRGKRSGSFPSGLDLPLPPVRAGDGADDLDAARQSPFNQRVRDGLRVVFRLCCCEHLNGFCHFADPQLFRHNLVQGIKVTGTYVVISMEMAPVPLMKREAKRRYH